MRAWSSDLTAGRAADSFGNGDGFSISKVHDGLLVRDQMCFFQNSNPSLLALRGSTQADTEPVPSSLPSSSQIAERTEQVVVQRERSWESGGARLPLGDSACGNLESREVESKRNSSSGAARRGIFFPQSRSLKMRSGRSLDSKQCGKMPHCLAIRVKHVKKHIMKSIGYRQRRSKRMAGTLLVMPCFGG
jgi:hypothetical protein